MARKPYQCSRCGLVGHNAATCGSEPRPPKQSSRATSRCSNCGKTGHNRLTCGKQKQRVKTGRKNQCQRCKAFGHNRATCTNAPDEFYVPPVERTEDERYQHRERRWRDALISRYPALIEQVGTVPDAAIAAQYGITRERVRQIRSRLGVSKYTVTHHFTPEQVAVLGTVPDKECVERFGFPLNIVQQERERRGIPSYRSVTTGHKRRLLESVRPLLGKVSDPMVARMLGHGLAPADVWRYRMRHDIKSEHNRQGRWAVLDRNEIRGLVEEGCTDEEIAQHLNAHPGTVSQIRTRELGFYHRGPPTCGKCGHQGHTKKTCDE